MLDPANLRFQSGIKVEPEPDNVGVVGSVEVGSEGLSCSRTSGAICQRSMVEGLSFEQEMKNAICVVWRVWASSVRYKVVDNLSCRQP